MFDCSVLYLVWLALHQWVRNQNRLRSTCFIIYLAFKWILSIPNLLEFDSIDMREAVIKMAKNDL